MTQRDKDIADLKKNSGANEELKEQLKTLQTKYQTDTENLNKTIETMRFDSALDTALMAGKAKSAKAVKALLDLNEVKMVDGKITGLDAQLEALKSEHDYLFETAQGEGNQGGNYVYQPAGGQSQQPDFSKMSDVEYYAYMEAQKKG
ncbi:MAG: phage scaffolding protein [Bacillota bacterium]|nr:phage scaffolding protein [Bacillota bacterium]